MMVVPEKAMSQCGRLAAQSFDPAQKLVAGDGGPGADDPGGGAARRLRAIARRCIILGMRIAAIGLLLAVNEVQSGEAS
jgi:hypothetical protein